MDPVSGPAFLRNVLVFGRELRREGLAADLATVLDYARALELVDIGDREEVRSAGAALFVRRRDQLEPYDLAFARFWRRNQRPKAPDPAGPRLPDADASPGGDVDQEDEPAEADAPSPTASSVLVDADVDTEAEAEPSHERIPTAWSAYEILRTKSFEQMTPAELREAERAIDRMVPTVPLRRTRRWELDGRGVALAPRAMLRRNLSYGGDLVEWVFRRQRRRPRAIVLLCDISGSMERHSRLLLRLGHAMAGSRMHTEAFAFGTRLTRITPLLRERDPDRALDAVAVAVGDWSGGTRIGTSFRDFNRLWARRVLRSSGIVIVVSDGWDRGDPRIVGEETARLRRNCHRLIWLNPLAGSADYRPLAGGMAAALPHVDRFLSAHDLASLEHLSHILATEAFTEPRHPSGTLEAPLVAEGSGP